MTPIIISVEGECEVDIDMSTVPKDVTIELRYYDVPVDPSRPECYAVGESGRVYRREWYFRAG